jgi:hypothetical protein
MTCFLSPKQNSKHWQTHGSNDTLRNYSQPLHSLARAILLTIQGHASGYQFPLTPESVAVGKSLLEDLDSDVETATLFPRFHKLIHPCFSAQNISGEYSKWNEILECFMAIYALKDDGNFENGADLTQFFAKLKYLCRSVQLYASVESIGDFGNDVIR